MSGRCNRNIGGRHRGSFGVLSIDFDWGGATVNNNTCAVGIGRFNCSAVVLLEVGKHKSTGARLTGRAKGQRVSV